MKAALLAGFLALTSISHALAATVAYWRFEEGTAGTRPPDSQNNTQPVDSILDSSGNGNHLRTFNAATAPIYISTVPAPTIAQTTAPNNLALGFAPNQDLFTAGKPINSQLFNSFTIEASFRPNSLTRYQTITGRD